MSKKLEKNGLWESSRMMLPQHREALQHRQQEQPVQKSRPKTEEIELMKDYVLLPVMESIVMKRIKKVEVSSETLKSLYSNVAHVLADYIRKDLTKTKQKLSEQEISIFDVEKDDHLMQVHYFCRGYEDSFMITKDYMRSAISRRLSQYMDSLLTKLGE